MEDVRGRPASDEVALPWRGCTFQTRPLNGRSVAPKGLHATPPPRLAHPIRTRFGNYPARAKCAVCNHGIIHTSFYRTEDFLPQTHLQRKHLGSCHGDCRRPSRPLPCCLQAPAQPVSPSLTCWMTGKEFRSRKVFVATTALEIHTREQSFVPKSLPPLIFSGDPTHQSGHRPSSALSEGKEMVHFQKGRLQVKYWGRGRQPAWTFTTPVYPISWLGGGGQATRKSEHRLSQDPPPRFCSGPSPT